MKVPVNYIQAVTHEIKRNILAAYVSRGHQLTGKFVESLRAEVIEEGGDIVIQVSGLAYGIYLNRGVSAEAIRNSSSDPTQRKSGGSGGKSLRIEGLKTWCKLRLGLNDKDALSRAFSILANQRKYGMPSRYKGGSKFLQQAQEQSMAKIKEATAAYLFPAIMEEIHFNNLYNKSNA
jgi:hypothetical protein